LFPRRWIPAKNMQESRWSVLRLVGTYFINLTHLRPLFIKYAELYWFYVKMIWVQLFYFNSA
jgi:hypothetical protein